MNIIKKIRWVADEIFGEYYFLLLSFLGLFLIINYARVNYILASDWNGWSVGDWIINYDLGFIRRGLSGEIVRWISHLFNIKLNISAYLLQCLIYFSFIILFIHSLKNKKLTFFYFLLCFTPGFLLFTYYDGMAVGRKEIILYALFALWVNFKISNKINIRVSIAFGSALFLLTLMHESFFFYSLYFYLIVCLGSSESRLTQSMALVVPLGSAIALVITFLYGQDIDGSLICADLLTHGVSKNVCEGVIGFGNVSPFAEIQRFIENFRFQSITNIILIFSIIIIPNMIYLASINNNIYSKRQFLLWNIFIILLSFPLFIIAIDWGRWIAIHITLSVMSLTIFLDDKNEYRKVGNDQSIFKDKIIYLVMPIIIFIFSITFYSLQHCCESNYLNLFGPIKKIATSFGLIK